MSVEKKNWTAMWICPKEEMGDVCPVFSKTWRQEKTPEKAVLYLTALGVYEAYLNGRRVGDYVLAPGWTAYEKRLQYQEYDVTSFIREEDNELCVTVGKGWFASPMPGWKETEDKRRRIERKLGILGELVLDCADGTHQIVATDETWTAVQGAVRFSEIYDGESYDAGFYSEKRERSVSFHGQRIF